MILILHTFTHIQFPQQQRSVVLVFVVHTNTKFGLIDIFIAVLQQKTVSSFQSTKMKLELIRLVFVCNASLWTTFNTCLKFLKTTAPIITLVNSNIFRASSYLIIRLATAAWRGAVWRGHFWDKYHIMKNLIDSLPRMHVCKPFTSEATILCLQWMIDF